LKNWNNNWASSPSDLDVKPSIFISGAIILAGATLLGGVIQGQMSGRWGRAQELQVLVSRLKELPAKVGDWQMRKSENLSPAAEAELECAGYVLRKYEHRKTGEIVTVFILLGPSGPTSVHTPDVCFSSREYTTIGDPEKTRIGASQGAIDELWSTSLASTNLTSGNLRVYYGWTLGGSWSAPKNPRITFAAKPYLYKIQVVGPLPSPIDDKASDQALLLLNDLLPAVKNYMIAPGKE
jgi:hypothetical protein